MKKTLLAIIGLAILATGAIAITNATKADDILGLWFNQEKTAKVKIEKIGSKYYGRIVWLETPNDEETGKPRTDKENPDNDLKSAPLKGLRILKDFTYDEGSEEWKNGTIYDPKNGKTYSCIAKMNENGGLDLRGYVLGVKALGRTSTWTRP